jgi:hypothetical protein
MSKRKNNFKGDQFAASAKFSSKPLISMRFCGWRERPMQNRLEQLQNELRKLGPVVSFVVSFDLKINETIENKGWCAVEGLNLRPLPCQGNALPLS